MFAVCRGNFDEGINFENELSRAVVIIGVPNIDFMNPRIKIEEKFLGKQ